MSEEARPTGEKDDFISIDVPASHLYVPVVEACAVEVVSSYVREPSAEADSYSVRLAIHEACINIVDHAYRDQPQGRICMIIFLSELPMRLVIELRDTGQPFDPNAMVEPDLDQPHERGYGLFLMRALLDEIHYERISDGNRWLLVKNLPVS